jgi:hypothetical protein
MAECVIAYPVFNIGKMYSSRIEKFLRNSQIFPVSDRVNSSASIEFILVTPRMQKRIDLFGFVETRSKFRHL